jgi:competence protein ComEC
VSGEVELKNWQDYYEEKPMFFSYEYMKLSDSANYNVSNVKSISKLEYQKSFGETAYSLFHATSENLKGKIPQRMSEPYAAIAQGISTGEQENLQKDIKDIFKKSGLVHILVLSGANVTFIISLLWFFLQRFRNRLLKTISAFFLSWTFIFMTGLTAPSVRAGVMSSTGILAEYFAKNIGSAYSLLFALFILTLVSPLTIVYSPSLHLSFLACFGLFVATPKIEKYLTFKSKFVRLFVATFFGIFIFVTPYLLGMSGEASLFGTALTFLVEPLVMLSTVFSFLIILFSFASFNLAEIFGILNTFCTKIILQVAEFGSNNLPLLHFQIAPTFLVVYYFVLILIFAKWYNLENSKIQEKR